MPYQPPLYIATSTAWAGQLLTQSVSGGCSGSQLDLPLKFLIIREDHSSGELIRESSGSTWLPYVQKMLRSMLIRLSFGSHLISCCPSVTVKIMIPRASYVDGIFLCCNLHLLLKLHDFIPPRMPKQFVQGAAARLLIFSTTIVHVMRLLLGLALAQTCQ